MSYVNFSILTDFPPWNSKDGTFKFKQTSCSRQDKNKANGNKRADGIKSKKRKKARRRFFRSNMSYARLYFRVARVNSIAVNFRRKKIFPHEYQRTRNSKFTKHARRFRKNVYLHN